MKAHKEHLHLKWKASTEIAGTIIYIDDKDNALYVTTAGAFSNVKMFNKYKVAGSFSPTGKNLSIPSALLEGFGCDKFIAADINDLTKGMYISEDNNFPQNKINDILEKAFAKVVEAEISSWGVFKQYVETEIFNYLFTLKSSDIDLYLKYVEGKHI